MLKKTKRTEDKGGKKETRRNIEGNTIKVKEPTKDRKEVARNNLKENSVKREPIQH